MGIPELLELLQHGGTFVGALLILWGGYKRIWVWGWQLEAKQLEADQWRRIAERAADVADKATPPLPPR